MKRIFIVLALLLGSVFGARSASAEVARSAFASPVTRDVLRAAACSMQGTVSIAGRAHPLAVQVGYVPCQTTKAPADALSIAIRTEPGSPQFVVVESEVEDGVDAEPFRTAVALIANDLAGRVARAMAPVTIVPSGSWPTPSAQELPAHALDLRAFDDVRGWHKLHRKKHRDPGTVVGIVLGSTLGAALVITAMCVLLANAHFSLMGGGY